MVYSVQVKRLRNEDPLQALILRGSKRKSREEESELAADPDFVFRLAQTYDSQQPGNNFLLQGSQASSEAEVRKYRLAGSKRAKKNENVEPKSEEDQIPAELQSMIAEYIKPQKESLDLKETETDKETEDYVYDVYFSEQAGPLSDTQVGYIDIDESEEKLLFGDSDSEVDDPVLYGDEDSNAEDYYKNEYPDDEGDEYGDEDDISDVGSLLGDLHLEPESWSEEDADDVSYDRYGWR